MRDGLYHSTVWYPEGLVEQLPTTVEKIIYCSHALKRAKDRGVNKLPRVITDCEIPEVEVKDGEIVKALYKTRKSANLDICLVFHIKHNKPFMVRTLWINNRKHKITIDKSRYVHEIDW